MSGRYDKLGLRFLYPENWHIADEELGTAPQIVSVHNPSGAFWTVMVYEPDDDPTELVDEILSTMRSEYDELETASFRQPICEDLELAGFDLYFYCLNFVVNSRIFSYSDGERILLLIWQAEDREFVSLEPVFRAITTSLLSPSLVEPGSVQPLNQE